MICRTEKIGKRECRIYEPAKEAAPPDFLLLQAVDDNDLAVMDSEIAALQKDILSAKAAFSIMKKEPHVKENPDVPEVSFVLAAFPIFDWNSELTPWEAPPVRGGQGYGAGAPQTLDYVLHSLLPFLQAHYDPLHQAKIILGGYSLAGLFALWAGYQKDYVPSGQEGNSQAASAVCDLLDINNCAPVFSGIAAASPSVWYPGWIQYIQNNRPQAPVIYLSLGDREEKARNPVMSTVGTCIRQQYDLLQEQGITCTLEWNPGNHFKDSDLRTARAFAWVILKLKAFPTM